MTLAALSLRLGARAARRELGQRFAFAVLGLAALAVAVVSGLETAAVTSETSAQRAQSYVLSAAFGLALPLVGFVLAGRLRTNVQSWLTRVEPRHGADRRVYALGHLGIALALSALTGIVIGLLGLVLTRLGSGDAAPKLGFVRNALALVWVGAAGGAAYAAGFQLATLLGQNWGRAAFLLADWLLGSGVGALALPWPRAHLRALVGGSSVLGAGEWLTSAVLLALALGYTLLYAARIPR